MIYATDLDRTLIFSERFLELHPATGNITLVDKSKIDSYIADKVVDSIKELLKEKPELRVVPVTTRSISEYKRVKFPFSEPEYAITTCGGKILRNEELMTEWEDEIASKINRDELESIREELNSLQSINYESKIIDNSYVFSKSGDIQRTKNDIAAMQKRYPQFFIKLDKHKVYLIPKCFNKGSTLMWLKHYLNEDVVLASGDSTFDVPMLNVADISVIPSHGSIKDSELKNLNYVSAGGGINSPLVTLFHIRKAVNA